MNKKFLPGPSQLVRLAGDTRPCMLLRKGTVLISKATAQSVGEMQDLQVARPGEALLLLQQVVRTGQPKGRVGHSRG